MSWDGKTPNTLGGPFIICWYSEVCITQWVQMAIYHVLAQLSYERQAAKPHIPMDRENVCPDGVHTLYHWEEVYIRQNASPGKVDLILKWEGNHLPSLRPCGCRRPYAEQARGYSHWGKWVGPVWLAVDEEKNGERSVRCLLSKMQKQQCKNYQINK